MHGRSNGVRSLLGEGGGEMSSATVSRLPEQRRPEAAETCAAPAAVRPGRLGRFVRLRGLREILLIAAVYSLYDLSRFVVEGRQAMAFSHAMRVVRVERDLDINWEHALNRVVSAHWLLAVPADYIYATLHYVVTPVVLVWLWRRHNADYSRARTTLLVATIIGLVGFALLPVAPPRMLPGFVDTMGRYAADGWWGQNASAPRGLGGLTNQFAAMPSLHVGWALWCGWQLIRHGKHLITRVAGVLYPALITVVVVATGNHYLLDAVAGFAVVLLAVVAVRGVARLVPQRVIDLSAVEERSPQVASTCA
jgi:hypothetical protein